VESEPESDDAEIVASDERARFSPSQRRLRKRTPVFRVSPAVARAASAWTNIKTTDKKGKSGRHSYVFEHDQVLS